MRHVLAWDLGTSGAKVGLVDAQGSVLGTEFEPTQLFLLPAGGAEQSPDDWWRAFLVATERLLACALVPRATIAAVAVTAQWAGTVPVNREGRALHNALIWMDARGAVQARARARGLLSFKGYAAWELWRWIRLTGGAPGRAGKDPYSHVLWFKHVHPELFEQTHKFLEPKDYLTSRLTGRFAASFDSIALHWVTDNRDPNAIHYDDGLLKLAGLSRDKLPELLGAADVLGELLPELCERFGLARETVVTCGAPDVHSAAVGAGATRDFDGHLYVGTSSWIACHVPHKKTSVFRNMAALPSALPGRYLVVNDQETAGACLVHLRDKLFFPNDALSSGPAPENVFRLFDELAATSPPGSGGLFFLPWLYGERTPVEDSALRGAFVNYSLMHDRKEVIRAVLEGVAMNTRWLLQHVEAFVGREFSGLRFIGGGARSRLWAQIFADVLGRPIHAVSQPQQANLRGAALIAFAALGELRFDELPARVPVAATFEPDPQNRAVYERAFAAFLDWHRATRPVFHRLNG